ncbi:hypothetical protein BsWGS_14031 [Bradybaena similaris]
MSLTAEFPIKRHNFYLRSSCSGPADNWDTTYKTSYVRGYRPPTTKTYNYQSPYGQLSQRSRKALDQDEKKQRLVTLQQPSIINEPVVPELSQLCQLYASARAQGGLEAQGKRSLETRNRRLVNCLQCVEDFLPYSIVLREQLQQQAAERCGTNAQSGDCFVCDLLAVKKPRVYRKDLPSVPRLPLPCDISEPRFVQLQAKHWKGMPYPFADPRFDPFIPTGIDGTIAPSTLDPFKYCQRKRTFPQFNRLVIS